jgi:hypothetical protein
MLARNLLDEKTRTVDTLSASLRQKGSIFKPVHFALQQHCARRLATCDRAFITTCQAIRRYGLPYKIQNFHIMKMVYGVISTRVTNPVCTNRLSLMKLCTVKYCTSDWRCILIYCLTLILPTWLLCEIFR